MVSNVHAHPGPVDKTFHPPEGLVWTQVAPQRIHMELVHQPWPQTAGDVELEDGSARQVKCPVDAAIADGESWAQAQRSLPLLREAST